ncbi:hypothetical protein Pth03_09630 [Planotetraspora thailandica]|uniref:Uncharacterized protein n=1 Tax=Planotetraspora thailandica TaxID=487172 RepID=A0A8J3V206_9ACTN|nr:hypothetical protein Pth03_09630 [Planotetraspora thailandica]
MISGLSWWGEGSFTTLSTDPPVTSLSTETTSMRVVPYGRSRPGALVQRLDPLDGDGRDLDEFGA